MRVLAVRGLGACGLAGRVQSLGYERQLQEKRNQVGVGAGGACCAGRVASLGRAQSRSFWRQLQEKRLCVIRLALEPLLSVYGRHPTPKLSYHLPPSLRQPQVEQTLRRVGRLGPSLDALAGGGVAPAVPCADPWAYRNKVGGRAGERAAAWVRQTHGTHSMWHRPVHGLWVSGHGRVRKACVNESSGSRGTGSAPVLCVCGCCQTCSRSPRGLQSAACRRVQPLAGC